MFFPSRIDTPHSRIIGHAVYGQHVGRRPGVDCMCVRITAKIVEARNHRFLKALVDDVLAPEIAHPVLYPFKIRDRYSSSIGQNVRDDEDSLLMQHLIRSGGGWTIRTLSKNLTLDLVRVLRSNLIFCSRRNQDVALQLQEFAVCDPFDALIALERASSIKVFKSSGNINTVRVVYTTVHVGERDHLVTRLMKQAGCDAANIARPLNYDPCCFGGHSKPFYCFVDYK